MPGAISFVGSAINAFSPTKNTQQLLSDAGTSTGYSKQQKKKSERNDYYNV